MNKNCAFTICATNYIGLAKILQKSIHEYYTGVDFYIVVADEPSENVRKTFDKNIIIAKDCIGFPEDKWYEMAFKYNLTEFCTSIKPKSITYLFSLGYEKCIYFDPDILCFKSIKPIYEDCLLNHCAVVTPHYIEMEETFSGIGLPESDTLRDGVFNLGFIGVKKCPKVEQFLVWWSKRLEDCCYCALNEPYFTDQKWVDRLPCYLGDELLVSLNKGMNLAPWNYHERVVAIEDGRFMVYNRIVKDDIPDELMFVHFSGYNYKQLVHGEMTRRDRNEKNNYEDTKLILDAYLEKLLKGDFGEYIDNKYTYNYLRNDEHVPNRIARRIYRAYIQKYGYDGNPFEVSTPFTQKALANGLMQKDGGFMEVRIYQVSEAVGKKTIWINRILKLLYKIMGPNKYFYFIKAFRKYGADENHYFLIRDDNYCFFKKEL